MVGSKADNALRIEKLKRLHKAGYRGTVSITAYYAVDVYELTDAEIKYKGRKAYGADGWEPVNFRALYSQYVTEKTDEFTVGV